MTRSRKRLFYSPSMRRRCSLPISSVMVMQDNCTSSPNGGPEGFSLATKNSSYTEQSAIEAVFVIVDAGSIRRRCSGNRPNRRELSTGQLCLVTPMGCQEPCIGEHLPRQLRISIRCKPGRFHARVRSLSPIRYGHHRHHPTQSHGATILRVCAHRVAFFFPDAVSTR